MDTVSIFFGVLCGLAISRPINYLVGLGKVLAWLQVAEKTAILLLQQSASASKKVNELKYKQMEDGGFSQRQIDIQRGLDENLMESWAKSSVTNLLNSYSDRFRATIPYYDWATALNHLEKLNKGK